MNVTANFTREEFVCKDGCGLYNMQEPVLFALQQARNIAGIPFKISSGSRCARHNRACGGKSASAHLDGLAVDVAAITSTTRAKVLVALLQAGFQRVGVAPGFIHADLDIAKPYPCVWLY